MVSKVIIPLLINVHIFSDALVIGNKLLSSISLLVVLITLLIVNYENNTKTLKLNNVIILLLLLLVLGSIGFFVNIDSLIIEEFIRGFLKFAVIFLVIFLLYLNKSSSLIKCTFDYFLIILSFLAILGILQFLSIYTIEGTRSYLTFGQNIGLDLIRATSYFDEPSAFAKYLLIGIYLGYIFNKKFMVLVFIIALFTSMSLGGIIAFLIFAIVTIKKIKIRYLLATLFILFSLILFDYEKISIMFNLIYNRIESHSFGAYRSLAPIYAIDYVLSGIKEFLFGYGIGQTQGVFANSGLPENPNTTHFIFTDLLLEFGIMGLLIYLYSLYQFYKIDNSFFAIILGLSTFAMGYRSPIFLIVMMIYLYLYFKRRVCVQD